MKHKVEAEPTAANRASKARRKLLGLTPHFPFISLRENVF